MPTDTPCADSSQLTPLPAHYTRKPAGSYPQLQSGTASLWLSNSQVKLRNLRFQTSHVLNMSKAVELGNSAGWQQWRNQPRREVGMEVCPETPPKWRPLRPLTPARAVPEPLLSALWSRAQVTRRAAGSEHGWLDTRGSLKPPGVSQTQF